MLDLRTILPKRVFVRKAVKTMRVSCDNMVDPDLLEQLHIRFGKVLKQPGLPHPSRLMPTAELLLQYAEVHPGLLEDFAQVFGDFLSLGIIERCTPNKIEHIHVCIICGKKNMQALCQPVFSWGAFPHGFPLTCMFFKWCGL